MNVLFLPDFTGLNPYQVELVDGLRQHGYDVSVSDRTILPLLSEFYDSGPDVVHFHWLQKFIIADSRVLTTLKLMQFFFELTVVRLASNATIVWTVHNRHEHKERWLTVERYTKYVFVMVFCDRLIVHCSTAEDAIVDELGLPDRVRDDISVIPHGNYIHAYENTVSKVEARDRLGLPNDESVLLFMGSIRPYKQVPKLVETFDDANVDGMRLLVVGRPGNGELATKIEQLCRDNDRIDVTLQAVPEDEIQVYLNATDAVVLPLEEDVLTSGSVVLGMSFGRAIIAPRVGCISETVPDDGGILYDPGDAGLRSAIESAATADLEALGRQSLSAARELEWGTIARRTADVYEDARHG